MVFLEPRPIILGAQLRQLLSQNTYWHHRENQRCNNSEERSRQEEVRD
jgi:hypothetical protein